MRATFRTDRRLWLIPLAAVALAASIVAVVLILESRDDRAVSGPVIRPDAVADLLGWIPLTAETRRAFAVWTDDLGDETMMRAVDPLIASLSLSPMPRTLGRSTGWRDRFGYGAQDVTSWATAGDDASLTVLGGTFDSDLIERKLKDAGYRSATHVGVRVWVLNDIATPSRTVDGDTLSAANAMAIFAGRLILSDSADVVRAAIDSARGTTQSLADDGEMAKLVSTLSPLSALVVVAAADHAIDCGLGGPWTRSNLPGPSDRLVAVGFGRLGAGGERRTMVAMSFSDAAAAARASGDYESGWISGVVNAAGAGAEISVYGRVSVVSQTDNLLIAELVEGREDGWILAGIRFATPVCEAAASALPAGTPATDRALTSPPAAPT